MRSVWLTVVFAGFLAMGFRAPFIFGLGYIWIDLMTPQLLAYSLLSQWPVSLLMGGAALLSIPFVPKDSRPRFPLQSWLMVLLALWMSLSLLWAAAPAEFAREKWDTTVKTLFFCAMLPALLRTRVHVEAALWVIATSAVSHAVAAGLKTALGGGGYGKSLGLIEGNSLFGEGSTLAMVAVMLIPLWAYLGRHGRLLPYPRACRWLSRGAMAMCVLTAIGTQARTGLVCLLVLALLRVCSTRHVVRNLAAVAVGAMAIVFLAPDAWFDRMATTSDTTEHSSMARVAVWKWVLEYVSVHPVGGSFNMYVINDAAIDLRDGTSLAAKGLAYHNLFFEILGEGGFPGLALFLLLLATTLAGLAALNRRMKRCLRTEGGADPGRVADLALSVALRNTLLVFLVGGSFINVGWRSMFYLVVVIAASLIGLNKTAFAPVAPVAAFGGRRRLA